MYHNLPFVVIGCKYNKKGQKEQKDTEIYSIYPLIYIKTNKNLTHFTTSEGNE